MRREKTDENPTMIGSGDRASVIEPDDHDIITGEKASPSADFLDRCTSCGTCITACPLLTEYGTPDAIILRGDESVFLCTDCKACTALCPAGLAPSEALQEAKNHLLMTGRVSDRVFNAVRSLGRFAWWGQTFPFSSYSSGETVFWPGCALAGSRPDVVLKAVDLLSAYLERPVGMALDCCFDPAYQAGDRDAVRSAVQGIRERFRKHGIRSVVTGCANCQKIFSDYLPEVNVRHIMEALPSGAFAGMPEGNYYLHHPCPSQGFDGMRRMAKEHLSACAAGITEQSAAACCGLGGVHALSLAVSNAFTRQITVASEDSPIVTYCMGCKRNFLDRGKAAYHMLEFLPGVTPVLKTPSPSRQWLNRFLLALRLRMRPAGGPRR